MFTCTDIYLLKCRVEIVSPAALVASSPVESCLVLDESNPARTLTIFSKAGMFKLCIFMMLLIGMFLRAPEAGSLKAPMCDLCHTVVRSRGWPNNLHLLRNMVTHRTHSSAGLGFPRCQLQLIAVMKHCCEWGHVQRPVRSINAGSSTPMLWFQSGRWRVDHIKI